MRITKVTTHVGDDGTTRLAGGARAWKDDPRLEAYGTVDELNSVVGLARAHVRAELPEEIARSLDARLEAIQHRLFDLGGELATPPEAARGPASRVGPAQVDEVEAWVDELNAELPPLREFVLPAGGTAASALHVARTVCRRAERRVVALRRAVPETSADAVRYLNRLGDWFFVAARVAARAVGDEATWVPGR